MITYCDVNTCEDCPRYGDDCDGDKRVEHTDLISRADAIEAVRYLIYDRQEKGAKPFKWWFIKQRLNAIPSAEAEQGDYAKWLENIIVKAETIEWLCEDTPCKEWCDENCHYSSIQAECLRHLYEVSKGGGDE